MGNEPDISEVSASGSKPTGVSPSEAPPQGPATDPGTDGISDDNFPDGVRDPGQQGDRYDTSARHARPDAFVPRTELPVFSDRAFKVQFVRIMKRLPQPDSNPPIDDFVIQNWMDALHELRTVFRSESEERNWDPFNQDSHFYKHLDHPPISNALHTMLHTLNLILEQAPEWTGIRTIARKLIRASEASLPHLAADTASSHGALARHTHDVPYYQNIIDPLPKMDQPPHGLVVRIETERLHDAGYRRGLAIQLFRFSRGNPRLANLILRDLVFLITQRNTRPGVIRLIREFIPLGRAFNTDDAIVIRDYAHIVGSERPFWLLTTPTIFPPENWSKATLEGLRARGLNGKTFIEIGTGSGILPLYAVEVLGAASGFSYDIDPAAQFVGFVNAWLHSTDETGEPLADKRPVEQLRFSQTLDLLDGVEPGIRGDVIFGCLPQVPTRDTLTTRNQSDRYTPLGYPENDDGLELLARMLEQGRGHLNSDEGIWLTVSGRPGLRAIEQMALRRGYVTSILYETVFDQDRWTELAEFVRIEKKRLRDPFQFMLLGGLISATRADQVLRQYRSLFQESSSDEERRWLDHRPDLHVQHRQYVVRFVPIDRHFETMVVAGISAQRDFLLETHQIGYTADTGQEDPELASEMAHHLSSLAGVHIPAGAVFVGPSRNQLLANYVRALDHGESGLYIDPHLDPHRALVPGGVISTQRADMASSLILPLSILNDSPAHINELLQWGRRLLFVGNRTEVNALDRLAHYLIKNPRQHLVSVLWEFDHDLPGDALPALIFWNQVGYGALKHWGEDTYSRVPTLRAIAQTAQLRWRREQGLAMVKTGQFPAIPIAPGSFYSDISTASARIGETLAHQSTEALRYPGKRIDMSFGESEMPLTDEIIASLPLTGEVNDQELRQRVANYLAASRRTAFDPEQNILLGTGVHPLIEASLRYLAGASSTPLTVLIPRGSYGQFIPTILAAGGTPCYFDLGLDRTPEQVTAALEQVFANREPGSVQALLLPYPTNPAGHYCSLETLRTVVRFCQARGITLLVDEVFFNTGTDGHSLFELTNDPELGPWIRSNAIGFDGLSKTLGLGGLRFGFAYAHPTHLQGIAEHSFTPLDPQTRSLASYVLDPTRYPEWIANHQAWLAERRRGLLTLLEPYRTVGLIHYREPSGGFFVEVDVAPILGSRVMLNGKPHWIERDGSNLQTLFYEQVGIKISPVGWSGNPSTIRLVYSIRDLDEAMARLRTFLDQAMQRISPDQVMGLHEGGYPEGVTSAYGQPYYIQLTGHQDLPVAFQKTTAAEAIQGLSGPTVLHLDYGKPTTRVVSVLIHGTDDSGLQAVLGYLQNPLTDPPTNLVLIVHNVLAARHESPFQHRQIPGAQQDLHRKWPAEEEGLLEADPYVQAILAKLKSLGPIEAIVDFHNTSGNIGPFSVLIKSDDLGAPSDSAEHLAHHQGDPILTIALNGTFVQATAALAPSVVIENGRTGAAEAHAHALNRLHRFLVAPVGFLNATPAPQPKFQTEAIASLRDTTIPLTSIDEEASLAPGTLGLRQDIEQLNLRELTSGTWIARWSPTPGSPTHLPIVIRDGRDRDVTGEYIFYQDGKLYLIQDMALIMPSLDLRAIHNTELFYLGPRDLPSPIAHIDQYHIAGSVRSADNRVGLKHIRMQYSSLEHRVGFIFEITGGTSRDRLDISYANDPENPDYFGLDVTYIECGSAGTRYGFEMLSNLFRYNHGLPRVQRAEMTASLRSGRFAWRHFDGFRLKPTYLQQVRKHLLGWNTEFQLGLDESAINRAVSPWDFVHVAVLDRPIPELLPVAQEGWDYSTRRETNLLDRTKNLGELALLTLKDRAGVLGYPMTLDLRYGNPDYLLFIDSLIAYWQGRKENVSRAVSILESLREEREGLLSNPLIREQYRSRKREKAGLPDSTPTPRGGQPASPANDGGSSEVLTGDGLGADRSVTKDAPPSSGHNQTEARHSAGISGQLAPALKIYDHHVGTTKPRFTIVDGEPNSIEAIEVTPAGARRFGDHQGFLAHNQGMRMGTTTTLARRPTLSIIR